MPKKKRGRGAPKKTPTITSSVRTTKAGWRWLKKQARTAGHTSVGKWAAAEAHTENSIGCS